MNPCPNRLDNKVAIVTAGAGRIGSAVVRRLIGEGAKVAVVDLRGDAAQAVADLHGDAAIGLACDMADVKQVEAMVAAAVDRFGRLDILHNNAAFPSKGDGTAIDTSFELWDASMAVSLRGYFAAAKYAIPHMIAGGGGSIINTTSCAGLAGDVARIAYATAKAGILGFTQSVATQHGHQRIRCNAIAPGLIADEGMRAMMPGYIDMFARHIALPFVGEGDDIAAMVAFLASEDARYITGECYRVDGGYLARQPLASDLRDAG
ncbi:SDR family NAD(P)-dependent oxidoreductase [Sphingomonas montanisoli]|uniref:SDR family oxidoreductase n=1 Tax=Sphingomonas montanisoli TaxID=2606412 RepID=A0A5D9CDG1_9SPHN|nr:SDR family NAD(P)-dependent oxidoreductase [Sphingomonas montanisoli]TZG29293.1 SDR family oxidoreductase [Sphingomonas montanisoli]